MLTRFKLANFKSIGKKGVDLNLKPLTILFGPNGSGKSSILEGLALFAQSVGNPLIWHDRQPGAELIGYPKLDFIYKGDTGLPLHMEVHTRADEASSKIEKERLESEGDNIGYSCKCSLEEPNSLVVCQGIYVNDELRLEMHYSRHTNNTSIRIPNLVEERVIPASIPEILSADTIPTIPDEKTWEDITATAKQIVETIHSRFKRREKKGLPAIKVFYLSAFRGRVPSTASPKLPSYWVGKEGENLLPLLSHIFGSPEFSNKAKKIEKWADEFQIPQIWAAWRGDENKLKSGYRDSTLDVWLDLRSAGHGSRQILAVITQLFWSDWGDIIMVEEPEISLHPKAQAKLPELFADAINEGKQVIITTHSEFLPYALINAVGKGKGENYLNAEDIAVYHTERNGSTKVEQQELDNTGYIKDWIPSFNDIDEDLAEKWFKTLEE